MPIQAVLQIAVALLLTALLVVLAARWAWNRRTAQIDAQITALPRPPRLLERASLPEPVVGYLGRSAPEEARRIEIARLRQHGRFKLGDDPERWRPFTATEVFRVVEPGFYWDARITVARPITVRVRDEYHGGKARMTGKAAGIVPVLNSADDPRLAKGALIRYLAEAVWFPTRLASGPGLEWTPVDALSADAQLEDRGVLANVRFTFDESYDPVRVRAVRPREVSGDFVDTEWVGHFSDHRPIGGFRIPFQATAAWVVDGVESPYWDGVITGAAYTVC